VTLLDQPAEDPATEPASEVPAIVGGMCPYLLADGGAWRAARPSREQRCMAVEPAGRPSLEKQRRLCLVNEHAHCPFYQDAIEERARARTQTLAESEAFDLRVERRVPRSAAVALDRPTSTGSGALLGRVRGLSRVGLAAMMVGAVLLLVVARFLAGGALGPAATPTPTASVAVASPTPFASATATASPAPTPSATASPQPSPSPSPARTYTVQSGDTLSKIAAKFGTTVVVLKALNDISNADVIQVGQVLQLP
jgi:nucleoid-associated protein YgaU